MAYLGRMYEFCLPTRGIKVPFGAEWYHEIKFDGYRLFVERNGDRVRLITRGGYEWTRRFPWIVQAALKNRQKRFVIDGRPWCSVSTASPTSTRCIPASTMPTCSYTPSTYSRSTATTYVACR
jgi:hypothetical protein